MIKTIALFLALVASCLAFPTENRIVNGTNAALGEIPYIVSLQLWGSHFCGGSILDESHILTAAHCMVGVTANGLTVKYGFIDLEEEDHGNRIPVGVITPHPKFDPKDDRFANDVAVLSLSGKIEWSNSVRPVYLSYPDDPIATDYPSILAGWGLEKTGGEVQRFLQRVDLKIYSPEECTSRHNGMTDPQYHVCSGVDEGGKGQCSGDSGGPLLANGAQVGIVSWSVKPCTLKGFPGVFTRVAKYVDWINEQRGVGH